MDAVTTMTARAVRYELEIPIRASRERVWRGLTEAIDTWWLPDFHMVHPGSRLSLDARAGGHLLEQHDSGSLLWYTVQACTLGERLYLFGHIAPDWGGPATTLLKLELAERNGSCTLKVTDALFGNVTDANVHTLQQGWTQLFTDGLKKHVER